MNYGFISSKKHLTGSIHISYSKYQVALLLHTIPHTQDKNLEDLLQHFNTIVYSACCFKGVVHPQYKNSVII